MSGPALLAALQGSHPLSKPRLAGNRSGLGQRPPYAARLKKRADIFLTLRQINLRITASLPPQLSIPDQISRNRELGALPHIPIRGGTACRIRLPAKVFHASWIHKTAEARSLKMPVPGRTHPQPVRGPKALQAAASQLPQDPATRALTRDQRR
jgi:hypothetical protein